MNRKKQGQLLQSIFGRGTTVEFNGRGINIYRQNVQANAARALTISYPTVAALLGEQLLGMFASQLIKDCGKREYDWGLWGADLPDWLDQHPIREEHPYLSDCARLDWAIHLAERAEDQTMNLASFQNLGSMESYDFSLKFASGATVIDSNYPIVSIYEAHRDNSHYPDLKPAIKKLKQDIGETAVIWRPKWRTEVREADKDETTWLELVRNPGLMLSDVLKSPTTHARPLERWLSTAIEQQLVIGLRA